MMEFLLDWKTVTGLGALLVGGGALAMWLSPGLIALLIGSKLGRYALLAAGIAFAVLIFLAKIFAAGGARERLRLQQAREAAKRERIRTDEEIRTLPADKRRERLERWVRD